MAHKLRFYLAWALVGMGLLIGTIGGLASQNNLLYAAAGLVFLGGVVGGSQAIWNYFN